MSYFDTSDEWMKQSALLLEAQPFSTRVTSKYKVKPFKASKWIKSKDAEAEDTQADAPGASTAIFSLKTYDPVSGVCLRYETNKAAEVGRLVSILGGLGKNMAALPDAPMTVDALAAPEQDAVQDKAGAGERADTPQAQDAPKTGGGGGKKKKKGKK